MIEKGIEVSSNEESPKEWVLWREDIHGSQYRMKDKFESEDEATILRDEYAAKGHHQTYFIKQMEIGDDTDFIPAKQDIV